MMQDDKCKHEIDFCMDEYIIGNKAQEMRFRTCLIIGVSIGYDLVQNDHRHEIRNT